MPYSFNEKENFAGINTYLTFWLGLGADTPIGCLTERVQFNHMMVQVEGVFAGASVVLEGSLDGENYHTLKDASGSPIFISVLGDMAVVQSRPISIRPRVIGATDDTDLDIYLLVRKL